MFSNQLVEYKDLFLTKLREMQTIPGFAECIEERTGFLKTTKYYTNCNLLLEQANYLAKQVFSLAQKEGKVAELFQSIANEKDFVVAIRGYSAEKKIWKADITFGVKVYNNKVPVAFKIPQCEDEEELEEE